METLLLRQADEKRLTADVGELAELVELTTVPLEGKVPNFHFARAQLGGAMIPDVYLRQAVTPSLYSPHGVAVHPYRSVRRSRGPRRSAFGTKRACRHDGQNVNF